MDFDVCFNKFAKPGTAENSAPVLTTHSFITRAFLFLPFTATAHRRIDSVVTAIEKPRALVVRGAETSTYRNARAIHAYRLERSVGEREVLLESTKKTLASPKSCLFISARP